MIMDKKNPITQSLVRHIIPSEENAKVISEFYPGTTMQDVKKALDHITENLDKGYREVNKIVDSVDKMGN